MALRLAQINIKALDPAAEGRFWAAALGWEAYAGESGQTAYVGTAGGLLWPDPVFAGIDLIPVPESKSAVKNRLHLDLATTSASHQASLVGRLRDLGATPADIGQGDVP